jgi:hypothetical protein
MATLRAATAELHTTASEWHTLAGELTATEAPISGLAFQPSARAVAAIHAAVTAAGGVLSARTVNTAFKATAAAIAYAANEETSAATVNAISAAL